MLSDVIEDAVTHLVDTAKAAPADLFECDLGEEPFHLVKPAAVGGDEMQVPPGMPGNPAAHGRRFVGRVVVQHHVDVQMGGSRSF